MEKDDNKNEDIDDDEIDYIEDIDDYYKKNE